MSEIAGKAVFLSYASQDAEAARHIWEALGAAGVEVWFDQSELRGGDAWDQNIRRQIKQCALFVPIISPTTNARHEGYFRLEWRLADQRTYLMGRNKPFLLPVAIADADDSSSDVPDSFLAVQWTRLDGEDAARHFAARIREILEAAGAPRGSTFSAAPPKSLPPTVPRPETIAVLPFTNLTTEPANEIFCDGVSEELIAVLSRVRDLRVAARTSAFSFKGRGVTVEEIGRRLGVAHILEGSVRTVGHRVRINAQLVSAANGFHLWSESFDRELSDIFAVQDEIAGLIARHLKLKIASQLREPRTVIPQAHRLTLEGRHYWNQRTHDGFTRAELSFLNALQVDPAFAPAHAGLADVYNVRALYCLADGELDAGVDLARARLSTRQALDLDRTLGEAHATLGFVEFLEGKLDDAVREFELAFVANPNNATGYAYFSWVRCCQGRIDEGVQEHAKAIELDPLSFINLDRYAAQLALAGRFADALAWNERAASLRADVFVGNLSQRAPILLALGQVDAALEVARAVRRTGQGTLFRRNSDADAIYTLRAAGFAQEAADYGTEVLGRLPADGYVRGFVLGALGRFADAVPFLDRTPMIQVPHLFYATMWDSFRDDPLFGQLIRRLGRPHEYALGRKTLVRMPAP